MADQLKDLAEIPRDFIKDGTQFINRCTKHKADTSALPADRREFLKISQAVGVGFLVMGVIGYIVKLTVVFFFFFFFFLFSSNNNNIICILTCFALPAVHIPVNNILVGGA
ncbi:hypothetical protein MBLNU459_g4001t2 [Dothideomycetes sp. NU459]